MEMSGWLRRRRDKAPSTIHLDQIYPYLVPEDYPDALSTRAHSQRRIGHGLSVALVTPTGPAEAQILAAVDAEAVAGAGIDLPTAYRHADGALSTALSAGQIALEFFDRGPAGSADRRGERKLARGNHTGGFGALRAHDPVPRRRHRRSRAAP